MTTQFIGTTFPLEYQWGKNERQLVHDIQLQIQQQYPDSNNLLINTTWFGPQFPNNTYAKFKSLCSTQTFDHLFLLAGVDPICLTTQQIQQCAAIAGSAELHLLGNFETQYQFNFISTLLSEYFEQYTTTQLMPIGFKYLFVNYNRKPHNHRVSFVNTLEQHNLIDLGIVTLGNRYNLNELPNAGNWGMHMNLGIPHDIHSLGNMDIWCSHFLNIVSETINLPWDPLFVTEKTFKPILGLRPFVINGQPKVYKWLRDNGFRTFNHYWPHVNIEDVNELEVPNSIVKVIKYLQGFDSSQLNSMYQHMLPDLQHNREHFATFSSSQKHRINNLFAC
jgi:hypothetical protein